jgi:hypothetical protein
VTGLTVRNTEGKTSALDVAPVVQEWPQDNKRL